MSALGQKQTYAPQKAMSALPPKADMCSALGHVCFGPKADIAADNGCVTKTIHSMTVSAISSRLCGIVKPSVFAALELITNSNFVDRKTGRSPIFSPLVFVPCTRQLAYMHLEYSSRNSLSLQPRQTVRARKLQECDFVPPEKQSVRASY
jgi:hypothetical protein